MKGLTVSVYRDADGHDCTNGGITSKHTSLTLVGEGCEVFEVVPERPAVCLVRRDLPKKGGGRHIYLHAVPADEQGKPLPGWWMFGGNYIATSDSRFPGHYPIAVHDRKE